MLAYLQRFLTRKARGFVCTKMTVKDILDMWGPQGPDVVQRILRDDFWYNQLAFVQHYKNPLVDAFEDLVRIAS
jgi:hypothetical protein